MIRKILNSLRDMVNDSNYVSTDDKAVDQAEKQIREEIERVVDEWWEEQGFHDTLSITRLKDLKSKLKI